MSVRLRELFLIDFAFISVCPPDGYDPNGIIAFGENNYDDNPMQQTQANQAFFAVVFSAVFPDQQGMAEYCFGVLKINPVTLNIRLILVFIPFKFYIHSIHDCIYKSIGILLLISNDFFKLNDVACELDVIDDPVKLRFPALERVAFFSVIAVTVIDGGNAAISMV